MVSDKARAGKYVNPYVASQVVRGTIYDRNGRALAMEVPRTNVYVNSETRNAQDISQILAAHTGKTPDEIVSAIERPSNGMVLVVQDVPYDEVSSLKAEIDKAGFGSDEVSIVKEYARDYPALFHAAQQYWPK